MLKGIPTARAQYWSTKLYCNASWIPEVPRGMKTLRLQRNVHSCEYAGLKILQWILQAQTNQRAGHTGAYSREGSGWWASQTQHHTLTCCQHKLARDCDWSDSSSTWLAQASGIEGLQMLLVPARLARHLHTTTPEAILTSSTIMQSKVLIWDQGPFLLLRQETCS